MKAKKIRSLKDLRPDDRNANRGTERGKGMIQNSLRAYGAGRSVLCDRNGKLIAGNKTVENAAEAGLRELIVVPTDGTQLVVVQRTDLDLDADSTARELAIADNRTSEINLHWDEAELKKLQDEGCGLEEFFSDDEMTEILARLEEDDGAGAQGGEGDAVNELVDRAAELQKKWKVKRGDLWQIGRHRLACGDCREPKDVARALGGATINVAVTSPPYAEQREYDEASGFKPIPPDSYVEWFRPVAENVAAHLAPDGSWFVNIKPSARDLDTELYVFDLVLAHVRLWGWHLGTEFCWERLGVPKRVALRFKNQFEPVYQFARGRWKMRPENVRHASDAMIIPGGKGSGDTSWDKKQGSESLFKPRNVKRRPTGRRGLVSDFQGTNAAIGEYVGEGWAYPGNRLPPMTATHEATGHSAAFPVGLPAFFIKAYSDEGDVIYEPFCGSGSTLVAAEQNERRAVGLELSPKYCAITLERMSALGLEPKLIK